MCTLDRCRINDWPSFRRRLILKKKKNARVDSLKHNRNNANVNRSKQVIIIAFEVFRRKYLIVDKLKNKKKNSIKYYKK